MASTRLNRLDLRGHRGPLRDALPRPVVAGEGPVETVREILDAVRRRGDDAVREYTARFDGVSVAEPRVPAVACSEALQRLPNELSDALLAARDSIEAFHTHELPENRHYTRHGITVDSVLRPVERAGLYVPGGRAVYPSTVLMTAIPARVAGVDTTVLCVPPASDGTIPDITLAAAAIAGVDEVYAVGGAQAIAAMAYGTAAIPAVDVIVGPGNVYVAIAKREVAGIVGVPSAFAGPSEIVVIADGSVPPEDAAIDVVVQAEHGPQGLAWLIAWSAEVIDAVDDEIEAITASSPRRSDIEATLAEGGYAVLVDSPSAAIAVANAIAPEHLQLMVAEPDALVPAVRHAGAVFCGALAPASLGDYYAGPSHVLPTDGTARFANPLTVRDFLKDLHLIRATPEGFARAAPIVATLATAEGLDAHARSVTQRLGRSGS